MNNLWIFGDSFSAPFNDMARWSWFREYLSFLNQNKFDTWQEIVARDLNLNLKELGETSISNSEIFERFATNCGRIQEEDTVIINWTNQERFRIPEEKVNKFINIIPGFIRNIEYTETYFSVEEIEKIGVSRMHNIYQVELNNWANLINEFCKSKNVRTIFWGLPNPQEYYDFRFSEELCREHKLRIVDHQVVNKDRHFSTYGHVYVANKMIETLVNYKKKSEKLFIKKLI